MRSVPVFVAVAIVLASVPSGAVPETNEPPIVDAGLDQSVERGDRVFLDGGGSYDPEEGPLSYSWSVEAPDGSTLEPEDPEAERTSFVAAQPGRYYVTLTVTDDRGNARSDTLYVDVESAADGGGGNATEPVEGGNDPPSGEIVGPDSVVRGASATFTANAYDPDGSIHSYAWSVGGDGRTVRRTFSEPVGSRVTVSVLVGDDAGATTRLTRTVTVIDDPDAGSGDGTGNAPPTVDIDGPTRIAVGESATFLLSASDADGTVVSRTWTAPASGSGATFTHSFDGPGTYTVAARVVDEDGASATATHEVAVYGSGEPVVSISGPDAAPSGSTRRYTLSAYDPDGGPLTIDWDPSQTQLERGATRFENVVSIDSPPGATVAVSATVTDDEGHSVTVVKETKVTSVTAETWGDSAPVVENIYYAYPPDKPYHTSRSDTIEGGTYSFTAVVKNDVRELVRVRWKFNDSTRMSETLGRFTGTRRTSIEHQFVSDNGGMRTVGLWVTAIDEHGDSSTRKWVSRVHTIADHDDVRFVASYGGRTAGDDAMLTVPVGSTVSFDLFSLQPFRVEYGDGHVVEGSGNTMWQQLSHRYEEVGTYTVLLASIQGPKGYGTKRVTIEVSRNRYLEYWYRTNEKHLERTVMLSHPPGPRWSKVQIHHAERYFTGDTFRYPGSNPQRIDPGKNWVITNSYTEQRVRRDYQVTENDPDGSDDGWTLIESNVRREMRTYYEDQYRWYEESYNVPGWSYTGETRSHRIVHGDGHDHDRVRHSDTDRTSCADWRLDPSPYGGFDTTCVDWNYDTDIWYTGHDHDGWVEYDTDYRYHREVERTREIWLHKYVRTTTETVPITVFSETASRNYWLWERSFIAGYRTDHSLTKPPEGTFVEGTLRRVEVTCEGDRGHFDAVMC